MKKICGLSVLVGVLLSPIVAEAGQWRQCYPALAVQTGASLLGNATRTIDAGGNNYISFASSGNQAATVEVNFPSYLSSMTISATIYGRINSTTATNNVCFAVGGVASVGGSITSKWQVNDGDGPPAITRTINPFAIAQTVVSNSAALGFVPADQSTPGQPPCASVATCANTPSRVRVTRYVDNPVCNLNDAAAFEMIELCLMGTTP